MAAPDAVLLFALRRTHARIHVEHDAFRRTATMDGIDPTAGEISKSRKGVSADARPVAHGPAIPSAACADRYLGSAVADDFALVHGSNNGSRPLKLAAKRFIHDQADAARAPAAFRAAA
jgi:hypothetical protein